MMLLSRDNIYLSLDRPPNQVAFAPYRPLQELETGMNVESLPNPKVICLGLGRTGVCHTLPIFTLFCRINCYLIPRLRV